jgi:hypothetical protein
LFCLLQSKKLVLVAYNIIIMQLPEKTKWEVPEIIDLPLSCTEDGTCGADENKPKAGVDGNNPSCS